MDCKTALLTLLDQVDYTSGACRVTEMVGAVLSKEVIVLAREAIQHESANQPKSFSATCPNCDTIMGVDFGKEEDTKN